MKQVTVLFARSDSIYFSFPDVDVWDENRDATKWEGGSVVITHPPCRLWSALAHMSTAPIEEKELALLSIEQVRKWGGVLEHPKSSQLWKQLPAPWKTDTWGGVTIELDQWHWGHVASKPTKLYIVGCDGLPPWPLRQGSPHKTVTGLVGQPGRRCTQQEREGTPNDFAFWLLKIARSCTPSMFNDPIFQ
jgi:hypothetical protein